MEQKNVHTFQININGIDVNAVYTQENIDGIFLPFLKKLTDLQKKEGKRILAIIAAPPGTGKSTLCEFLKKLSETTPEIKPIQVIGMDGFHRYQDYLTSHTTMRDGKEILMVKIKGAPVTFDLELFTERVKKVAAGENVGWPVYNRLTHNPSEDAIIVSGDIVVLEGNYLLLQDEGWKDIKNYADYTVRILADEKDLRKRLVDRKINSGASPEEAEAFVESSDLYNARLCIQNSMRGDLNLRLNSDDSYSVEKDYRRFSSEPEIADCGCIYG